jgi:glyoxylase-like metal-dependent hydrolase (beta-lactamase superfamily II)
MEIVPQVHQIRLRHVNIVLLIEQQITIIDAGLRGNQRRVLRYLCSLGRSSTDVGLIVVTHHHVDHIGGLARLKMATGAIVAAHAADAPYITGQLPQPIPFHNWPASILLRPLRPIFQTTSVEVEMLLKDGDELPALGGLKVIHTPGHSPGSICLFSPSKRLLIVGDALLRRHGQLHSPPESVSADAACARESIRRLLEFDFDTVLFGHGKPLQNHAREEVYHLVQRLQS